MSAEEAAHLARRKELFILISEVGQNVQPSGQKIAFAKDTENKTGQGQRDINCKIARAETLGEDIQAVVGTSLIKRN